MKVICSLYGVLSAEVLRARCDGGRRVGGSEEVAGVLAEQMLDTVTFPFESGVWAYERMSSGWRAEERPKTRTECEIERSDR
jgi:hypothetical protein